ncbi:MAG: thymidine phosphorylase [Peptoniphilaceae bacterium]|nr:thymidine phosphorylase [Peptoniphilaceae bacterium]MDY6085914.1 thymidine phosphorylase [Peptoniphilaceae bacterium]
MNIVDIIIRKRNGEALTPEEIHFFVEGVKNETIADYQTSALLMAIFLRGMDETEVATLTREMALSGDSLSFPERLRPIVDKHSSGGVGDKTSLVIAPVVAACGLPIAKLSGRGLGHTGGTIDKLESIPGFRTELTEAEFIRNVEEDGIAIMGQSADIAPVDKVLYALRDVTGTVDSIPLIAASIMSKKLADGSDAIVLDVKYGSGAFMKTPEEAIELAQVMVGIGEANGKKTLALITDMTQPLGRAVGNALEVREAVETLQGGGPEDFRAVCVALASAMLLAGEKAESREEAEAMVQEAVTSGRALQKLKAMVQNQGGDVAALDDLSKLPQATLEQDVVATQTGVVVAIDAETIGKASLALGAGRRRKEDAIDPAVGLVLSKKVGDAVTAGDSLVTLYANDPERVEEAEGLVREAYQIEAREATGKTAVVYARVTQGGVERLDAAKGADDAADEA